MGAVLKQGLNTLMARYPWIGDVRGLGLLLAFELVADRATMQPLPKDLNAHSRLVELAYERGLIIYSRRTRGGLEGDHFMVCPPMIVTEDEIAEILALLDDSLTAFAAEAGLPVG
jgi:4-aminobutyrate aminotransferase-like enzyme